MRFPTAHILLLIQCSFSWQMISQPEHRHPTLSPGQLVFKPGCSSAAPEPSSCAQPSTCPVCFCGKTPCNQLLCQGWALKITKPVTLEGFPWSKDNSGDTHYCAKAMASTGTTVMSDFVRKAKKRLLLLFRHNLVLCFMSSFWSVISLPFFRVLYISFNSSCVLK